ncbi:MAG: hypothetical protein KBD56_05455 [Candidatus Eisenbacteria bacterium]|nr:hypothetical protein [Candidatus Eisenbacteria bacterium]
MKTIKPVVPWVLILAAALPVAFQARAVIRNVPDDYPTIQAGIDACLPSDTVLVARGQYPENLFFGPYDITVASQYLLTQDPADIALTVIRSAAYGLPVVDIAAGQTRAALLCGFTITGATGMQGNGVRCTATSPTITYNTITNNCAAFNGGGIYVELGSPDIRRNTITGN